VENGYDVPKTIASIAASISTLTTSHPLPSSNSGPSRSAESCLRMPCQAVGQIKSQAGLQVNQSQIRHQSCPSLNNAQAMHLVAPKSCPTSAVVSPNSSHQLLLPINSSSTTSPVLTKAHPNNPIPPHNGSITSSPSSSSSCGKPGIFQAAPRHSQSHSLHPQCSGKERTPSSSFSTRVVVSGKKSSSIVPSSIEAPIPMVRNISSTPSSGKGHLTNFAQMIDSTVLPSVLLLSSGSDVEGHNYENTGGVCRGQRPCDIRAKMRDMVASEDSTSYENINMDYITRLTGEGFSQDLVIRALGISRNDIEMARDILHEFGTRASS
jgi:hypothetical protein